MLPLPILSLWKYRRLIGYGLAVLAMSVLAWRIATWRHGYMKREEAVAALHKEQDGRQADRKAYIESSIKAEKEAQALAHDLGEIRTRFANMATPLPKTLIVTREVPIAPEQKTCPVPRVSGDFVRLWNSAGTP